MKISSPLALASIFAFSIIPAHSQQVIMFSSDATPVHAQLFLAKADGKDERQLLPLTGMDYSPSFSSDGQWIIFTSERTGSAYIYRVHLVY